IATEFEVRFNDRLRVVREEARDPEWHELLEQPQNSRGNEPLIKKLSQLYEDHREQRLRRWTVVNFAAGRGLTYGRMPSGHEGVDEYDEAPQVPASSQVPH